MRISSQAFSMVLISALLHISTVQAEPIDLSAPVCPAPFKISGAKCVPDTDALGKLNKDTCIMEGVKFEGEACKPSGTAPAPECHNVAAGTLTLKGEKCLFDSQVQSSASGDYVGDYFKILAVPTDDPGRLGGPPGSKVRVLSQKPLGNNDKLLKVRRVASSDQEKMLVGDVKLDGATHDVKASDFIDYGAERIGWAYGVLAVPYKYYAGDKSFGTGVSVGPYVGRRWGRPGSAYTLAVAAAIGNVKGEVRDADKKVTSTPDLMAYSMAVGMMWDISKAQGVKPFKIGLFIGVDSVSSDDIVKFKNNRKLWTAFQIGFDFTDN